jgi:hypothetical protein
MQQTRGGGPASAKALNGGARRAWVSRGRDRPNLQPAARGRRVPLRGTPGRPPNSHPASLRSEHCSHRCQASNSPGGVPTKLSRTLSAVRPLFSASKVRLGESHPFLAELSGRRQRVVVLRPARGLLDGRARPSVFFDRTLGASRCALTGCGGGSRGTGGPRHSGWPPWAETATGRARPRFVRKRAPFQPSGVAAAPTHCVRAPTPRAPSHPPPTPRARHAIPAHAGASTALCTAASNPRP